MIAVAAVALAAVGIAVMICIGSACDVVILLGATSLAVTMAVTAADTAYGAFFAVVAVVAVRAAALLLSEKCSKRRVVDAAI